MSPQVVVFDYTSWIVQYPEFAAVTQPVAQSYFDRLTIGGMVDNTACSIISDIPQRTMLLNLAVSHLAYLSGALNPSQRQIVGRLSNATQGSVSGQFEYDSKGGANAAWWNQSSYGAQFYAMTLSFRTAFYVPPAPGINTVPGGAAFFRRRLW